MEQTKIHLMMEQTKIHLMMEQTKIHLMMEQMTNTSTRQWKANTRLAEEHSQSNNLGRISVAYTVIFSTPSNTSPMHSGP
ncbi:hypothetical protein BRC65_08245 [Halobacteriales archaeon QH_2_65_14]|nr:MAG: hypothetical protein BRC65_08245 [Halobacteriales archaeon QH_2_65_14]